MLDLSGVFAEANAEDEKQQDVLVAVEDVTLFAEKTTEADWGNNSFENNVDYTPSPPNSGDVELILVTAFDIWATKASGASIRNGQTTNIYNGKMYLFGGINGGTFYNDVWEYTVSTDSWNQLFPTGGPPTKRWAHSSVLHGDDIYIFGGSHASSPFALSDLWKYNITGNTWTQLTPGGGPGARHGHTAVIFGNDMYVYGGNLPSPATAYKELWKYNITGNTWTQLADGPIFRYYNSVVEYTGGLYFYGGRDLAATLYDDVWRYDISGDTWEEKTSGASNRNNHTAVIHNDRMYLHAGSDGSVSLKDTHEYNISLDSWTQLADGQIIRQVHSASIDNGKMFIFGGFNTPSNKNDLRKYYITPEYLQDGEITTDNIDIGEIPAISGEWVLEDIKPEGTSLLYSAEYSDTGVWGGEEVSIGAIIDGQAITELRRYWRVRVVFSSNVGGDETPTLQSIKADYTTFRKFNKIQDLGYEPLVMGVSSLTSKVDFFKPASIGKISIDIVMTPATSDWVYNDTLFNKIVRVKLGYVYPSLVESDYIDYFTGAIDDWDVDDGILILQLKDLSKDWKLPVPSEWENVGDDVVYINQHHTDIMLDLFQNRINVRDSGLLLDSFATVKDATPTYKATRTITGKVEDAKKLAEELRVLLFAFYLPRGDGKIGLKQFDKTEEIQTTFTDDNTTRITWGANSKSLINRTRLYSNWDGNGGNEENFTELDKGEDGTSQSDFRAIVPFELKDKWTRLAEASQIDELKTKILEQFGNMPSIVSIETDVKDIAYEAGDQVLVTTSGKNAPGPGGAGITDVRFLIISKNLDFEGSKIVFIGLKVAV